MNGGGSPCRSGGTGDAFGVELPGDRARRDPGGIIIEDAPDDGGLFWVDLALAGDWRAVLAEAAQNVIAVGVAAGGLAGFDPAAQAAPCLVGKILEKERVHRALKPDMQLGDFAFGKGHEANAKEGELLVEPCHIGLVARKPVERLGENDLEEPRARVP